MSPHPHTYAYESIFFFFFFLKYENRTTHFLHCFYCLVFQFHAHFYCNFYKIFFICISFTFSPLFFSIQHFLLQRFGVKFILQPPHPTPPPSDVTLPTQLSLLLLSLLLSSIYPYVMPIQPCSAFLFFFLFTVAVWVRGR